MRTVQDTCSGDPRGEWRGVHLCGAADRERGHQAKAGWHTGVVAQISGGVGPLQRCDGLQTLRSDSGPGWLALRRRWLRLELRLQVRQGPEVREGVWWTWRGGGEVQD